MMIYIIFLFVLVLTAVVAYSVGIVKGENSGRKQILKENLTRLKVLS